MVTVIEEIPDFQPCLQVPLVSPEETEYIVITNGKSPPWEGPGPDPCPYSEQLGCVFTLEEANKWQRSFMPTQDADFRVRFIRIDDPKQAIGWLMSNLIDLTHEEADEIVTKC